MRVSGLPNWGVHVEPGDVLRSNAAYDTKLQSTYENMGIVVSLLVPEDENGNKQAPGVDPFTAPVDNSDRCDSGGLTAATPTLCPNGLLETHGHYKENALPRRPAGRVDRRRRTRRWRGRRARSASPTSSTCPGDLSTANTLGVPKVPLGLEPAVHERRRRRRSCTRSRRASSRASARQARRSRSATARRARAGRSSSTRASSASRCRRSAARRTCSTGRSRSRRRRATSPARSSRTSAASIRRCAARSRSSASNDHAGRSPGPTSGRACRSTCCPCSNDEYLPPTRSRRSRSRSCELQNREVERWRRQVQHEPPPVRPHVGGDVDRHLGDRRGDEQRGGATTRSAHNTATTDACDLEWDEATGIEHADEPAGRVRLRHPVAPRRPRGRLAGHEPGDARVLRGGLAAGVAGARRPARASATTARSAAAAPARSTRSRTCRGSTT